MEPLKRLQQEYNDLQSNPLSYLGISVELPEKDNYFKWRVTLVAPKDSYYSEGIFNAEITFPEEYPNKAPEIKFLTPIYHLNVNPTKDQNEGVELLGHVSYSVINWWKPTTGVREILTTLFAVFYWQSP